MLESRIVLNKALENSSEIHEGQISLSHGFVPHTEIPKQLPPGYEILDDLAAKLPELINNYSERKYIKEKLEKFNLDMLDSNRLPDKYLARASIILDSLAHAYYYNQRTVEIPLRAQKDPLPEKLLLLWKQVTDRLGRPDAIRTNYDNFMCNWQKANPSINIPQQLDDVKLLIPAFNNNEERVFDLTIMLMELKFAPAILAIVEALEAVNSKNDKQLLEALNKITDTIEHVTRVFSKIEVNPYYKDYVDPVIWTKTVARFDGPIRQDLSGQEIPGVSGASSPLFHVLDAFIERTSNETELGKQIKEKQKWMPKQHVEFISAISKDMVSIQLKKYIEQSNNQLLKNTYAALIDAYAGNHGLLNNHRLKVFGFMELNFKAGRRKTNGGHSGEATRQASQHINLNANFFKANQERLLNHSSGCPYAKKIQQNTLSVTANEIILDISQTGLKFEPGERCAILPLNSPVLLEKILQAMKATGDEEIILNNEWKQFFVTNFQVKINKISLREFLKHAHVRPIDHALSLNLYRATQQSATLLQYLHAPKEGGYELWEILEFLDKHHISLFNNDTKQSAIFIIPLLLKPLQPRLYSVSPVYDSAGINNKKIRLTVGVHAYREADIIKQGVASNYLATLPNNELVSIQKVPAPDFYLPDESNAPIIMFAAGTGIAPFIGFIDKQIFSKTKRDIWLFLSVADETKFMYKQKLENYVAEHGLKLHVILSRSDKELFFNAETKKLDFVEKSDKTHKHINALIKENEMSICNLLIKQNAHLYVCGQSGFAKRVEESIISALSSYDKNINEQYIRALIANHRYHLDIFTPLSHKDTKYLKISEVAQHHTDASLWTIISGKVYDLTHFAHRHIGGIKILRVNAGIDATEDYNAIGHNSDPQIESQLEDLYIADVKYPSLNDINREIFKDWLDVFYTIVEMKNSLINNWYLRINPPPVYLIDDVYDVFINSSFQQLFEILIPRIYQKLKADAQKFLDEKRSGYVYILGRVIKELSVIHLPDLNNNMREEGLNKLMKFYQELTHKTIEFLEKIIVLFNNGLKEFEDKENDYSVENLKNILKQANQLSQEYVDMIKSISTIYQALLKKDDGENTVEDRQNPTMSHSDSGSSSSSNARHPEIIKLASAEKMQKYLYNTSLRYARFFQEQNMTHRENLIKPVYTNHFKSAYK